MILYGIKNCDSVKKAAQIFKAKNVLFTFVDFRVDGISSHKIECWLEQVGEEVLVNKRSTTWKGLSEAQKSENILKLLCENPTLIKRPIVEDGKNIYVGLAHDIYK